MKLIQNALLIDMAGVYMDKRDILVEGGKIKQVAPQISTQGIDAADIYNADGMIMTPGFVDIHTSVGVINEIHRFDAHDGNEVGGPVLPHIRALDAIDMTDEGFDMALVGGVTTTVASPGNANIIGGTCAAFKTAGKSFDQRVINPEICFYADVTNAHRKGYGGKDITPSTRMGTAALLRESLYQAKEYKTARDQGNSPKFNMKMESFLRVFEGVPIKFHADHPTDILMAANICEEFDIHGIIVGCTNMLDVFQDIHSDKIQFVLGSVLVTPASYEYKDKSPELAAKLQDAGVEFAVSTQHPEYNIEYAQIQLAYLNKRGMKNPLEAATIIPAKIMGLDERIGSIEVGKDADMLLWDRDPLDFYAQIVDLFIDGEKVKTA